MRTSNEAARCLSAYTEEKTRIADDHDRREADVIWKLSFRGRPVYLFLLIEFQSTGELIAAEIPEAFIPHLTYYPILVNEIPTETLLRIHNAVAAVFYVENADPQQLTQTPMSLWLYYLMKPWSCSRYSGGG